MPKNEENNISKEEAYTPDEKNAAQTEQSNAIAQELVRLLKGIGNTNRLDNIAEQEDLKTEINDKLTAITAISVAFPECSDVMLSLIKTADTDEITGFFNDYFMFCDHSVMSADVNLQEILDPTLLKCTEKWFKGVDASGCFENTTTGIIVNNPKFPPRFPPFWCLPPTCVDLAGNRHLYKDASEPFSGRIRRLFMADLVWLFFFDRMGIFKILGAILDDYAIKGKLPISNGSVNASNKDDLVTIVLESMTRKTKTGLSSTVRDRNISYRRGLGWIQEEGRKLNLDTVVNTAFTNLFHKFIQTALEFYKDKRLATAIQASTNVGRVSVATLTSIKDTIDLLKRAFDPFKYGRNYTNTLSGIVWAVAAMALIRELRTTLGIPPEFKDADEFIPAAYDVLIAKTSITPSETNRYDVHRDCAENARAILLDLEVIDFQDIKEGGQLELWLSIIEGNIEGYRTAYRSLTGIDLGTAGMPTIEQQV
jgi:hypothetical protein